MPASTTSLTPGTPDAARFDVLAALIEHHEARHWPIDPPGPVDAIRACMGCVA
ncbi:MAG TPA: hypothetical protein VGC15_09320 [Acetobacteraceae bacterium]